MRIVYTLVATIALALAAPATAATMTATLSTATPAKFVAGDTLWSCAQGQCTAANEYGRPVVQCQALAKETGAIAAFMADGLPLAAGDLAKCNSRAKRGADTAVAAQ